MRLGGDFRAEGSLQQLAAPVVKFSCLCREEPLFDAAQEAGVEETEEGTLQTQPTDTFTALVPAHFSDKGTELVCSLPKFDERLLVKNCLAVDASLNGEPTSSG